MYTGDRLFYDFCFYITSVSVYEVNLTLNLSLKHYNYGMTEIEITNELEI